MIETSDDLRHVIRALGAVDPDPGHVAEQVLEQINDTEARVVAGATLRDYVRRVLALPNVPVIDPESDVKPSLQMLDGRRTSSWKVRATQNQRLQAILNKAVYGCQGEWKHYGDCTEADLLTMVTSRRDKADELVSEAEHYEKVLGLLREHDVQTVRDLPEDVLYELYDRRRAS